MTETIPPVQMDGCSARQDPGDVALGYTDVSVSDDGVVIESVTPVSLRGGQ